MANKLDFTNKKVLFNQIHDLIMNRLIRVDINKENKAWRIYSGACGEFVAIQRDTDDKYNKVTKIYFCYMDRIFERAEIQGHELCDLLEKRNAIFEQFDKEEDRKNKIKKQLIEIILNPDVEYSLQKRDDKTKHFDFYKVTQDYKTNIGISKIYDKILEEYTHTNITFDRIYHNGNTIALIGSITYNDFDLFKAIQTRRQNDLARKNKIKYTSEYFNGVKDFLAEFQKTKNEVKGK